MWRLYRVHLVLPALAVLGGCVGEGAASSPPVGVVVRSPQGNALAVPTPPPPPASEMAPIPPSNSGPVVWQPGHWVLSGGNWAWQAGHYMPPPPGQTTWVPGRWAKQPAGGWAWLEGHWA